MAMACKHFATQRHTTGQITTRHGNMTCHTGTRHVTDQDDRSQPRYDRSPARLTGRSVRRGSSQKLTGLRSGGSLAQPETRPHSKEFHFFEVSTLCVTFRQHCRLSIWMVESPNSISIRQQDQNNYSDTETRCLVHCDI